MSNTHYERFHDQIADSAPALAEELYEKALKARKKSEDENLIGRPADFAELSRSLNPKVARTDERGLNAARMVRAIACSKRTHRPPFEHAKALYGNDHIVTRALEAGDPTGGGFLIEEDFVAELIELLRANSVVEASGPRRIPVPNGSLTVPKQTAGASGSWIGEGENLPHTAPTLGQVKLVLKKYGSLVAISNDLLKFSSIDVDRMVRDDLVRDAVLAFDLSALRGDGTGGQLIGLKNISGRQTFAANTTETLITVTEELGRCWQELMEANVNITNPGFLFAPRTWKGLYTARDGNGNLVFQPEMAQGTLFGAPFRITTQIPTNLGAGTDSEIYFVNFDDIVVGRNSSVEIDVSSEAAYHNGSSVVASFSLDQTVVRAIWHSDIQARHAESIVYVSAVQWGVSTIPAS